MQITERIRIFVFFCVPEYVAKIAESGLGIRPRIHTDFQQMLETEMSLDAVNIVTDTLTHQPFAVACFNAGLHVSVEKPMAITVSACHKMLKASIEAGKVLSVSENYRRDPMNRFVKMILEYQNKIIFNMLEAIAV